MAKSMSLNNPAEFLYDDESRGSASVRWSVWIRDFELFVAASGITDKAQKKAILLHVVGKAGRDIYFTVAKETEDYDATKKVLSEYFKPLVNADYEIYKFCQIKQRDTESIDDFHVRLQIAAANCGWTDSEPELRRQIMLGCKSNSLREYILSHSGKTIKEILEHARLADISSAQVKAMQKPQFRDRNEVMVKTEPVASVSWKKQTQTTSRSKLGEKFNPKKEGKPAKAEVRCLRCGYEYPHKNECPASNKRCKVCKEIGHFAASKFCKKRIKAIEAQEPEINKILEEEERHYLFATTSGTAKRPSVKIQINDDMVEVLVDSGANSNIMDEATYGRLIKKPKLQLSKTKLYPYSIDEAIIIIGEFEAKIYSNDRVCTAVFKVVKGEFVGF